MFKHILVPTDGSKLSEAAVLHAVQLAKSESADLTAITVSSPFHAYSGDSVMGSDTEAAYNDECVRRADDYLGFARNAADSAGVPVKSLHVFNAQPHEAIIAAARDNACDVVCMASHGRKGVAGLVLGSETVKVLTHSKVPVVVWR